MTGAPTPPKHDYERDRTETAFDRLRRLAHGLEIIEAVVLSIVLVVFGVLIGAVAGAMTTREWVGIVVGAILGAAAGVWLARRRLVRSHTFAAKLPEVAPALDAPHMPGIQEQFSRVRARIVALCFPFTASVGLMLIIAKDAGRTLPLPAWMHETRSIVILFAVAAASLVLIAVNSRCPQCRRFPPAPFHPAGR